MSWIRYNPNPARKQTGDCVVRAVSIAEGITWDEAYEGLTDKAYTEKSMPSINPIWADYLEDHGYDIFGLPNTCPRCYTVKQFTRDYPLGTYILGTGNHAVAVIDGNYIDTWDSGNEVPMYFFRKGGKKHGNKSDYTGNSTSRATAANIPAATADQRVSVDPADSGSILGAGTGGSQSVSDNRV